MVISGGGPILFPALVIIAGYFAITALLKKLDNTPKGTFTWIALMVLLCISPIIVIALMVLTLVLSDVSRQNPPQQDQSRALGPIHVPPAASPE